MYINLLMYGASNHIYYLINQEITINETYGNQ